jgi:hypothetical protein
MNQQLENLGLNCRPVDQALVEESLREGILFPFLSPHSSYPSYELHSAATQSMEATDEIQ